MADPRKKHFPLVSGAINFRKADEINRFLMVQAASRMLSLLSSFSINSCDVWPRALPQGSSIPSEKGELSSQLRA